MTPRSSRRRCPPGPKQWGALLLAATVPLACAKEPFYDDNIGVEGVPTEPGALSGVFAQKVIAATLVQVPIPGIEDKMGGGAQWLLLRRTFDPAAGSYAQTSSLCGGQNYEVHGTLADAAASTYRAVPDSDNESVQVDHASGEHSEAGLVQLWGIRGLENPATDPFPTSREEAEAEPFSSQIYDMDDDDEPGYTTTVTGVANGRAFGILRRQGTYRGVVLSADRVIGLASTQYESFIFGADDAGVEALMGGETTPYPDPKESWFEEVRVAEDADCDVVLALEESGGLSRLKPF